MILIQNMDLYIGHGLTDGNGGPVSAAVGNIVGCGIDATFRWAVKIGQAHTALHGKQGLRQFSR